MKNDTHWRYWGDHTNNWNHVWLSRWCFHELRCRIPAGRHCRSKWFFFIALIVSLRFGDKWQCLERVDVSAWWVRCAQYREQIRYQLFVGSRFAMQFGTYSISQTLLPLPPLDLTMYINIVVMIRSSLSLVFSPSVVCKSNQISPSPKGRWRLLPARVPFPHLVRPRPSLVAWQPRRVYLVASILLPDAGLLALRERRVEKWIRPSTINLFHLIYILCVVWEHTGKMRV